MPADLPPNPPDRRAIEIVPLGPAPVETHAPTVVPAPPADAVTTASRAFPHLVVAPVPAWPAPAMRTTRHPGASLVALATAVPGVVVDADPADAELRRTAAILPAVRAPRVVLDLVRLDDPAAERPEVVVDLTEADPEPATPPADTGPSLLDATRLRALLAREREALAAASDAATAKTAAPDVDDSPFPLPAGVARRTPKAVREDASAPTLRAEVAAAMARATGTPMASEPPASAAPSGRARDRLELVPLPEPEPLPVVVDLRARTVREPEAPEGQRCTACGTRGVIDVVDQIAGEVHVSCPACFRMWRTPTARPADAERG